MKLMDRLAVGTPSPFACSTCHVEYDAALTLGECPVCGTPSGDPRHAPRGLDPDQRLIVVVAVTMIANLLVLGGLAVLYLQL